MDTTHDTLIKPSYLLVATGCATLTSEEYVNVKVNDYKLTLLDYSSEPPGRQDLTPWVQPAMEEFNPTVRLSWYGDIDMDGKPLIVFHAIYVTAGPDRLEPAWDWGGTRYEIVIEGDPPTELTLEGVRQPDGTMAHPGYTWTAMAAVNAIPAVCDAAPGWLTQLDLGLVQPRGLVRK